MFYHHDQYAILSPFYTIRVAFTKGPQPLVGCYSIFKHHSAKSQPPHRPALHTCNKLSSSETTKNELDQSWTGPLYWIIPHKHFHFCVTWPPKLFIQSMHVSGSFSTYPLNLANSVRPTVTAALICLLMTVVMQSLFFFFFFLQTAVDKICRRLAGCISCRASSLSYSLKCKHMRLKHQRERSADLLIN